MTFEEEVEADDRSAPPGLLDPALPLAIRVLRVVAIVIAVLAGIAAACAAIGMLVLFIMCSGSM